MSIKSNKREITSTGDDELLKRVICLYFMMRFIDSPYLVLTTSTETVGGLAKIKFGRKINIRKTIRSFPVYQLSFINETIFTVTVEIYKFSIIQDVNYQAIFVLIEIVTYNKET